MQKLKICGVRSDDFLQSVEKNQNAVGAIGLNFYTASHRSLKHKINTNHFDGLKVGVWVNASVDDILEKVSEYRLNAVQLHGEETPKEIHDLKKLLPPGVLVWKAFRLKPGFQFNDLSRYHEADLWLFDGARPGSGKLADFRQIEKGIEEANALKIPYAIAGGIDAYNIQSFRQRFPLAQFLDTASGVEKERSPSKRELNKICSNFLNKNKYLFQSKNLAYRPLNDGDSPRMFEILENDTQITPWMSFAPYARISEAEWFITESQKAFRAGSDKRFGIFKEDILIGHIGLEEIINQQLRWNINRASIGYWLDPLFWNQGLMTEAVAGILEYGFHDLGLHKIRINHAEKNEASKRVIEKIGFKFIGIERESFQNPEAQDDSWHDLHTYDLLASEWKKK